MSALLSTVYFWGGLLLATAAGLGWLGRRLQARRDAQRAAWWADHERAYAAIMAELAQAHAGPPPSWPAVLELRLPATKQQIQEAFRTLSKRRHPDVGGSNELMHQLVEARDQGLQWLRAGRAH